MEKLINSYNTELAEPGCAPGTGQWGALISLDGDIAPVLPYLNAVLPDAQYDPDIPVLIWQKGGQHYACRPRDIRVANVRSLEEAKLVAEELVEQINFTWQTRDDIVPRFTPRKLASVLEIYKLLPRTNCRRCGYPTCMAFAAELRKSAARLDSCLPLLNPEYTENRDKIYHLTADN